MIGLLPAENWDYTLSDALQGVAFALSSSRDRAALDIPGVGKSIPCRSGRSAILTAIKVLDLPPGSRVGVSLYSCSVVFKAIKAAGHKPVFIDIRPDTYCMSVEDLTEKRSKIDALIAVHMFGNMCDMPNVLKAASGLPIIEDCAQSLGSMLDNKLAGTFGAISIFSFRSGKYLSVGEGGAVFSSLPNVFDQLDREVKAMNRPSTAEECVHVAKTFLRSSLRSKPLFGLIGEPLWRFYNKTVSYTSKTPIVSGQVYNPDLGLAAKRLKFVSRAIKKQRANSDYFTSKLDLDPSMLGSEAPGTVSNRYLYPIRFPTTRHRDWMADFLFRRNIETIKPYQDISEIAAQHYGYRGDCPMTEKISKELLVIPSYHHLKRNDVEHITQSVNKGWRLIRSCPATSLYAGKAHPR